MRLTEKVVAELAPESGDRERLVWDESMTSFGVRITAKGAKAYVMFYRTKAGVQRRPTLGPCDRMSLKDAREKARRWWGRVADGGDPYAEERDERRTARAAVEAKARPSQPAPGSVAELAKHYEEKILIHRKPGTREGSLGRLRNHILPAMGERPIREVTRLEVDGLLAKLSATPRAKGLVLTQLRHMFRLAEEWGFRPAFTNPTKGAEIDKPEERERFLSATERARLGKALADMEETRTVSQAAIDALRLLILTGCRKGEILRLRWQDVDWEARLLRLADSKTGPRKVKLNGAALAYLRTVRERAAGGAVWVCPGKVEGKPLNNLKKAWGMALRLADIEGVRIHDLRHAFATVGRSMGVGLPLIAGLLGHSQTYVTQRYAHEEDDPVRAAGDVIGAELAAALGFEVDGIAKSAREGAVEAPESKKSPGGG